MYCQSSKTNLCPKIRATQGKGMMPDGTSRLRTMDDKMIYHFMGCSTFSEYAVLASISLAKIHPQSNPFTSCVLGCGIPTGWGAVMNTPTFHANSSVAVWGLGAVGLAVIQAAKLKGATRIYGIDINPDKFSIAKEFGATECWNPKDGSTKEYLLAHEKWGIDFTYDCTGVVAVMREALEMAHRGFGESVVIGVAAAGQELATRPFQLVTGRQWKGTAFGGWKSVQDVPKLANKVLLGELPIEKYITHNFHGIEKIQDLIDALQSGSCLRGVLHINKYEAPTQVKIQVVKNQKVCGGVIKCVKHWSEVNQCEMTFNIFLPQDDVHMQRDEPFATMYFLGGLTCDHNTAAWKSGFAPHAAKHNVAIVFPDTSPRNLEGYQAVGEEGEQWKCGYGAGFYCNAPAEPWKKHFNMYDYITKELPDLVESYFHVSKEKRSIFGSSMGGLGAMMIAARNPERFRSVSAFAPIAHPTHKDSGFATLALKHYYNGDVAAASQFDAAVQIRACKRMPAGLVDIGTHDEFMSWIQPQELINALGESGHSNVKVRWQEGYDHGFYFVSTFFGEHIEFHAKHLFA
jgi:S-formylglutathione hydrolase